ncbi:MAG: ABC transporter permease [Olegusella sp.]|nr:ABC transporter permease [Olegusella sp.]
MAQSTKTPLIRITKRPAASFREKVIVYALAIVLALVVCGIVTTGLTGLNPTAVYVTMFEGAFGTQRRIWVMLQDLAMLLCVSLALAPAFRMKFWNLGGEGQVLIACFACSACMILLGSKLPNAALILVSLVTSVVAGAAWGFIPAFFKAKFNTNETLFTLMMNYVATQIVAYFVIVWENPKGSGKIGMINQSSQAGWLPSIANSKYLLNIIVVAVITVLMYVYMRYSKHGYELAVVGESVDTAHYAGINTGHVIMRTMVLSGAVCGIAGFLLVAGTNHTLTTTVSGGLGFTGVMVAWLAKFNPLGMIASSFLLVFMECGAGEISTAFSLNQSFSDILTGIILFFIIGSEFFISYQVHFRGHDKSAKGAVAREEA